MQSTECVQDTFMLIGGKNTLTKSYRRSGGGAQSHLAGFYSTSTEPTLLRTHQQEPRT